MIFIDANVFLRLLAAGDSSHVRPMVEYASELLTKVQRGEIEATTSEVVIHEVCYILGSKSHYGRDAIEIANTVAEMLAWAGLTFPAGDKDIYLRALDLWSQHPKLGFADSVIAARCERAGQELATFDRHFADLPFLQLWRPEGTATNQT